MEEKLYEVEMTLLNLLEVQNIFLRRYLNLPKYTPGFMLRMECGRVSQEVIITKQVLRFWVRIMKMEESWEGFQSALKPDMHSVSCFETGQARDIST
ncbi:hypothetical protein LAZ67_10003642 [Cordylochernes scorpioides]|uniref:Uncharacterized protein n=1 Tax=Cordylochernes scorpioides TaxID=51811 RepID=A0ABY6KX60_9ARAC|nr:hypothetical protein LAZ67_10003642 [Cordylochernes scorpioides]